MHGIRRTTCAALIALGIATTSQVYASPTLPPASNASAQESDATPSILPDVPDGPPAVSDLGAKPLSVKGCDGPERSREEVLGILSIAPSPKGIGKPDWDAPQLRPGASPGTIAQVPVAEIEQNYRSWQVCNLLGKTYQQMALETEQFIREDVYGDRQIMTPYSAPTLNEILAARAEADAAWGQTMQGPGNVASTSPRAIDVNGFVAISEAEDYVYLEIVRVTEINGKQVLNPDGEMGFRLVDGVWLIDMDGQLP